MGDEKKDPDLESKDKAATDSNSNNAQANGIRKWPKRLFYFLILLLVFLYVLPFILFRTSLKDSVIELATERIRGNVNAGEIQLTWLHEITVHEVEIKEPEIEEPALTIEKVQVKKPLLFLLLSGGNLGTISVEKPVINARLNQDGSNLERVFEEIDQPDDEWDEEETDYDPKKRKKLSAHLLISNGTINFYDERNDEFSGTLTNWFTTLEFHSKGYGPIAFDFESMLTLQVREQDVDLNNIPIKVAGKLERETISLELDKCLISPDSVNPISFDISGKALNLKTRPEFDIQGSIKYDFDRLTKTFAMNEKLKDIVIEAKGYSPIKIKGKVPEGKLENVTSLADIEGFEFEGEFGWKRISAHGFNFGEGALKSSIEENKLLLSSTAIPLNNGMVAVALGWNPLIKENINLIELDFHAERIDVTQDMSEDLFVFIAPIINQATKLDGTISFKIEDTMIPLENPLDTRTKTSLIVHQLTSETAPAVEPLAALLNVPTRLKFVENSAVEVEMRDRMIYHTGLAFTLGDVEIHTTGLVRIADRSIYLMAEFPFQPSWFDPDSVSLIDKTLINEIVRVPITGTIDEMKLEGKELLVNNQKFLTNTSLSIIGQLLRKRREKNPQANTPLLDLIENVLDDPEAQQELVAPITPLFKKLLDRKKNRGGNTPLPPAPRIEDKAPNPPKPKEEIPGEI